MNPDPIDHDRLEALLAEATPGLLSVRRTTSCWVAEGGDPEWLVAQFEGQGERNEANARIYAALRNAAPALDHAVIHLLDAFDQLKGNDNEDDRACASRINEFLAELEVAP